MPSVKIAVPHTMTRQQASEHLHGFMARIKEQYKDQVSDLQESWQGDQLNYSFRTFGVAIRGTVDVQDQQVVLTAELPLAALMFKGKIEQEIRGALTKALQ